jgi:DNA polymerase-3 subunit epsilon
MYRDKQTAIYKTPARVRYTSQEKTTEGIIMSKTIALDTETTGIGNGHRIIEIGAVEFDPHTGSILSRFQTYVNPQRDVPEEATKVHGIKTEDLLDKPLFSDVAIDFLKYIEGASLKIHNAPFDVGFLNFELKAAGFETLESVVVDIEDTCATSRSVFHHGRHSLDALCARYGVDTSARALHGALMDCELLAKVYPMLAAEAKKQQPAAPTTIAGIQIGGDVSDTLEEAVKQYLELKRIQNIIETEAKRYQEKIRSFVGESEKEGDFYKITFQSRTATDWKKVQKDHLSGVDLSAYQTSSLAMYIKSK